MNKNLSKKYWWKCEICDKIIKNKYPLIRNSKKLCAIYNPIYNCPEYLLNKYNE